MHWLTSVDPGNDPEPAGHGAQAAAPCWYVLLGHWVLQLAAPLGDTLPAAQGWQVADPPGDAVPAAQGRQPVQPANGSLPAGQLALAPVQPAKHGVDVSINKDDVASTLHAVCALHDTSV